jgi:type IV pilus assembly protein PilQ
MRPNALILPLLASLAAGATSTSAAAPRAKATSAQRLHDERTVTIDVMNAELQNVVRLIAEVSGKNVVMSDDVKGKVTIKLKNVGWREALHAIARTHGCGVVEEGNIIWVAPQSLLDAEEQAALDAAATAALKGPLHTRVLQLNNARAEDMAKLVEGLLTPRGTVTFDARTNTLIIRDIRTSAALSRNF